MSKVNGRFSGVEERTGMYSEHVFAEKDGVRYPISFTDPCYISVFVIPAQAGMTKTQTNVTRGVI